MALFYLLNFVLHISSTFLIWVGAPLVTLRPLKQLHLPQLPIFQLVDSININQLFIHLCCCTLSSLYHTQSLFTWAPVTHKKPLTFWWTDFLELVFIQNTVQCSQPSSSPSLLSTLVTLTSVRSTLISVISLTSNIFSFHYWQGQSLSHHMKPFSLTIIICFYCYFPHLFSPHLYESL